MPEQAAPVEAATDEEGFFEIEEPAASDVAEFAVVPPPVEVHPPAPPAPAVEVAPPTAAAEDEILFAEEATAPPAEAAPVAEVQSQPASAESVVASEAAEEHPAEAADEFEFELVPAGGDSEEPTAERPKSPMTSDQFLSELTEELAGDAGPGNQPISPAFHPPAAGGNHAPAGVETHSVSAPPAYQVPPHVPPAAPISALGSTVVEAAVQAMHQQPAVAATATLESGNLNELEEVFQEFRSELGEMNDEDEDLETHYNLGIAYREMGLLDEAIGEFQKVAKAIQQGKPFRYAMQCSTLLGLTFIDKGEPHIAALWYSRALETPGIDQETVLALRYDLGLAQEQAGDATAALNSFRQVYAVNIDYRDVAGRIATLQKR